MSTIHRSGKLRGDRMSYPSGDGCTVWYPFPGDEEDTGICFDFDYEDIDDFILLLLELREAEADVYEAKAEDDA